MNTENVKVSKAMPNAEKSLEQMISEWKAQYGKLYKTKVGGEEYIWRKLRRKEYVELMADKADDDQVTGKVYERQEAITRMVVLYPANIDELIEANAGLATTIADEVILKSGFEIVDTEEL